MSRSRLQNSWLLKSPVRYVLLMLVCRVGPEELPSFVVWNIELSGNSSTCMSMTFFIAASIGFFCRVSDLVVNMWLEFIFIILIVMLFFLII